MSNTGETHHLPWYKSPYTAQAVSIAHYAIKAALKITIGTHVASSMITGDGFHNLADIVPAVIVVLGIWIRRRQWKGFPFQLKEIESVLTLVIGLLLGFTGLKIGFNSSLGCLSLVPSLDTAVRAVVHLPAHEAVHVSRSLLWPLVGLMGGSFVCSIAIGNFQIYVGKASGELALVADGKETMTDGSVEGVGLVGVVLVQRFGWSAAEYLLGYVVMAFVLHTAWEIFRPSLDAILKRSLGEEIETGIREAIADTPGTESVERLATFHIGRTTGVCLVTVVTRLEANRHAGLRLALTRAIDRCLREEEDIRETEVRIDLVEPPADPHRYAYAVCVTESGRRIVGSLDRATHLLICDVLQGDTARSRFRLEPVEGEQAAIELAQAKKVEAIYLYRSNASEALPKHTARLGFRPAFSESLEIELGIPL